MKSHSNLCPRAIKGNLKRCSRKTQRTVPVSGNPFQQQHKSGPWHHVPTDTKSSAVIKGLVWNKQQLHKSSSYCEVFYCCCETESFGQAVQLLQGSFFLPVVYQACFDVQRRQNPALPRMCLSMLLGLGLICGFLNIKFKYLFSSKLYINLQLLCEAF